MSRVASWKAIQSSIGAAWNIVASRVSLLTELDARETVFYKPAAPNGAFRGAVHSFSI